MNLAQGWIAVIEGLPYILRGIWVTMTGVAGAAVMGSSVM